jgi:hypothetical protein
MKSLSRGAFTRSLAYYVIDSERRHVRDSISRPFHNPSHLVLGRHLSCPSMNLYEPRAITASVSSASPRTALFFCQRTCPSALAPHPCTPWLGSTDLLSHRGLLVPPRLWGPKMDPDRALRNYPLLFSTDLARISPVMTYPLKIS